MKMWIVTRCAQWEGEYPLGVLAAEGLDKYLSTRPAFHLDNYGGYTTYQDGNSEWYDITPWEVDSLLEA